MTNTVKYVAKQSATHTVHLLDGVFTADYGVLELPEKYADELDRLVNTGKRPDLVQAFAKVDEDAARKFVQQYREEHGGSPAALQGPMHSHATTEHQARSQNVASVLATTGKGPNIPIMPPGTDITNPQPPSTTLSAEDKNLSSNVLSLGAADKDGNAPPPPPGTAPIDPKAATENKNPLGNLLKPK